MRPTRLATTTIVAVSLVLGCARDEPTSEMQVVRLVDELPLAYVTQQVTSLQTGETAAATAIGAGWTHYPKRIEDRPDARWTTGERSVVRFVHATPGDARISIRFRLAAGCRDDDPRASFLVNGRKMGEARPSDRLQTAELDVPGKVLRTGENQLLIANPDCDGESGRTSRQRLLVHEISFVPGPTTTAVPVANGERDTLFLAVGTKVDFVFRLPDGGELAIDDLRRRVGSERLRVEWSVDGEVVDTSDDLGPAGRLELGSSDDEPGLLSLIAYDTEPAVDGTIRGVSLSAPRLVRPAPDALDAPAPPTTRSALDRPNILVYMIDTLRADHLGVYGYDRPTSPEIDEFAERSMVFERAQAQSPWTRSSVASVLTGLYPQRHGAHDKADGLAADLVTMGEIFGSTGYQTLAAVGNGNIAGNFGFRQGFDVFRYAGRAQFGGRFADATDLNEIALRLLDRRDPERPFLLYVHTIDPHAPYAPPEPFASAFQASDDASARTIEHVATLENRLGGITSDEVAELVDLYDAEIAANDAAFGVLLDELARRELDRDTIVVLLSDHGEEFYDHGGWTHGKTLHAEMLDTPLILHVPGVTDRGGRSGVLARHVDLLPTLLDLVGLPVPNALDGTSLAPALEDPSWAGPETSVASMALQGRYGLSVMDRHAKKVVLVGRYPAAFVPELYDKTEDPSEHENLGLDRPAVALELLREGLRLEAIGAGVDRASTTIDPELEDELRALGYVQ